MILFILLIISLEMPTYLFEKGKITSEEYMNWWLVE